MQKPTVKQFYKCCIISLVGSKSWLAEYIEEYAETLSEMGHAKPCFPCTDILLQYKRAVADIKRLRVALISTKKEK